VAQPQFVPADQNKRPYYESPPRRPDSWTAARPGEIVGTAQPAGAGIGTQGPDQGYALKIVRQFDDRLVLEDGERREDVVEGCLGVALKRASLLGRAPVVHDWTVAFTIFGYLDDAAGSELVAARSALFDQVGNPHHYNESRELVELVHDEVILMTPEQVSELAWRSRWTQP
jgi:hypothetical protein